MPSVDDLPPPSSGIDDLPPPPAQSMASKASGYLKDLAKGTINELPMIGGMIGGAIGTPADVISGPMGTVAGAGIGGYLGTAAKNAINSYIAPDKAPKTTMDYVTQPVIDGATQALMQGAGEAIAPYLARGIGAIGDKLGAFAAEKAVAATGATGKQALKFAPGAGQELLDRGIVGAGNSQSTIAQKTADALDASGQQISDVLTDLDKRGATVDHSTIVNGIRQRAAELGQNPSQFGLAKSLNGVADDIEQLIKASPDQANIPLSKAEDIKRGFQQSANYNSSPLDLSKAKEVASIYKNAVEDAATKFDPGAASTFADAKKTYGLLSPIQDAAAKRAATLSQSPHGGLLDTAAIIAGEGLAGAPGAVIAPVVRGAIATRIPSTLAAAADTASKSVGSVAPIASAGAPIAGQAIGNIAANGLSNTVGAAQSIIPAAAAQTNGTPLRGEDKWAYDGISKLGMDNDLTSRALSDPKGKQLLIQASDLPPGSPAMKKIRDQLMKGWGNK